MLNRGSKETRVAKLEIGRGVMSAGVIGVLTTLTAPTQASGLPRAALPTTRRWGQAALLNWEATWDSSGGVRTRAKAGICGRAGPVAIGPF